MADNTFKKPIKLDIEPIIQHLKDEIYIGLDIGGTLIKLVILCKKNISNTINFADINIEKFSLKDDWEIFYAYKRSCNIEQFLYYLKTVVLKFYRKDYINCTGGGCVKFKDKIEKTLNIKLLQIDEIESCLQATRLLMKIANESFYGFDEKLNSKCYTQNNISSNFLLVNIGTGVSYINVKNDNFERIGGTSIGGTTFLALCKILAGISNYDEILDELNKVDLQEYLQESSNFLNLKDKNTYIKGSTIDYQKKNDNKDIIIEKSNDFITDLDDYSDSDEQDLGFSMLTKVQSLLKENKLSEIKKNELIVYILKMIVDHYAEVSTQYCKAFGLDTIVFIGSFFYSNVVAQKLLYKKVKILEKEINISVNAYLCGLSFGTALACASRDFI